jgi:hypothetical protein
MFAAPGGPGLSKLIASAEHDGAARSTSNNAIRKIAACVLEGPGVPNPLGLLSGNSGYQHVAPAR